MIQNELKIKEVAYIGEEIGLDLGQKMVSAFQANSDAQPNSYLIGRNIIEKILNQPGCHGIEFYDALNEMGQKVLVYVGIDQSGSSIVEYSEVSASGNIGTVPAIVADRGVLKPGGKSISDDENTWFVID